MKRIDLQKIRRDKKLSQKQIAEILNVPQSFVSQVENMKSPMPEYWISILVNKLNISDVSDYEVELEEQKISQVFNSQNGLSIFNDIDKFIELLKSRDSVFKEIVQKKDEQIDRLLTIIENMKDER